MKQDLMQSNNKDEYTKLAFKAGILYLVAELLTRGISFMTTPVFTRLLPHAVFAEAKIYESWVYLLAPIVSLSLYQGMARAKFDYQKNYGKFLSSTLSLMTVLTVAVFVVCAPFAKGLSALFGFSPMLLILMLIYCLAYNCLQCVQLYDRQLLHYKRNIVLTFLGVIPGVATSLFLVLKYGATVSEETLLTMRIVGFFLPTTLVGIILLISILLKEKSIVNKEHWKYGVRYSVPLMATAVASQVFFQSATIFVRNLVSAQAAAIVAVAITVGYVMDIFIHAVDNAWKPWMFEQLNKGNAKTVKQFWKGLFSVMALMIWCLTLIAPELTLFLGGKSYFDAIVLICPILCGSLANFLMITYTALEQYYKKTRIAGVASILAAIADLILNYVFIQRYGYQAVVYTTAAAYLLGCILHYILVRRVEKENVLQSQFSFAVILGTFVVCMISTKSYAFSFWLRAGFVVLVLLVVAFLFRKQIKTLLLQFKREKQ